MSPTYDIRIVLGDIPMTLDLHSNRPRSIATKPYSDRFWPSLGRNPSNSRFNLLGHIKERVKNLIGQPLANKPLLPLPSRRYVAFLGALFYYYYFGRWNSTLSESVPKPKVFSRGTRRANPRWQPVHLRDMKEFPTKVQEVAHAFASRSLPSRRLTNLSHLSLWTRLISKWMQW